MGTHVHTCTHGFVGFFFTCTCLAVSCVTRRGEMFLAPRAKDEGKVVVFAYLLPKALTNFVTTFANVLYSVRLKLLLIKIK